MFDNVNGFVPNSHLNGQESADSAEPMAHYSPLTGLSGGPASEAPAGEPEVEPVVAVEPAQDTLEPEPDVVLAMPAAADEPAPAPEPVLQDVEPVAHLESSDLADETGLEPVATVTEPEAVVMQDALPDEAEAPAEDGAETPIDVEVPVEVEAELTADSEPSGEVDAPVEPDPTQPLPVGRPPSPLGLDAQIESLLFVADGPAPLAKLAEALDVKVGEVETALAVLDERYLGRGIAIQRIKDRVQLTTSATAAPIIQRFLGLSATAPLSKAALETLAIIAYRQPITRPQIEQVRGVNSDSVIKNLLTKGLVEEAGIAEGPGRPVLYITTPEFLQHFGLSNLTELPELNLDEVRRSFASEILKG